MPWIGTYQQNHSQSTTVKKYSVSRICTVNKHVRQITKLLSKSLQRMNCQNLPNTSTAIASPKNYYCFFKSKANSKINFLVSHHQRKDSCIAMMRFQDHFQKENSPPMMVFQDFFQCMQLKILSEDPFLCILCLYIWPPFVLHSEFLSNLLS